MLQWIARNRIGTMQAGTVEHLLYFEDKDTGVRLCEDKQARWVLVIEGDEDLGEMKRFGERAWVERERPASSTTQENAI